MYRLKSPIGNGQSNFSDQPLLTAEKLNSSDRKRLNAIFGGAVFPM